ncbi:MAG: hypothetical protein PF694_15150 [Bacteroidetes bacterium]|nr:hypothetical protein [Bacteroidota bacterium]
MPVMTAIEPKQVTLVIMAAGKASRFGAVKQLTAVDANGACLMDFMVFDAIRIGFKKIVLIVNEQVEADIMNHLAWAKDKVEVEFVRQKMLVNEFVSTNNIPKRYKPWGTGHALLTVESAVDSAFVLINADDFYGYETLLKAFDFLQNNTLRNRYAMVSYLLGKTLLPGKVYSRAICVADRNGNLKTLTEYEDLQLDEQKICAVSTAKPVPSESNVSMNCWAFTPDVFEKVKQEFIVFLERNPAVDQEFFLPSAIRQIIQKGTAQVQILNTDAVWFGLTYNEDLLHVQEQINRLVRLGIYPQKLW